MLCCLVWKRNVIVLSKETVGRFFLSHLQQWKTFWGGFCALSFSPPSAVLFTLGVIGTGRSLQGFPSAMHYTCVQVRRMRERREKKDESVSVGGEGGEASEVIQCWGEREDQKMQEKWSYNSLGWRVEAEVEESETRRVNMITLCAAAHPCVELVHGDNRGRWDTLFMLLIWLHIEKEAESCLNSIKKCYVVCILYLGGGDAERESL